MEAWLPADTPGGQPLIRVERGGTLTGEELAALVAVLLLRANAAQAQTAPVQPAAPVPATWDRLDRRRGYRPCTSWQRSAVLRWPSFRQGSRI
jgi:hypothetical protein